MHIPRTIIAGLVVVLLSPMPQADAALPPIEIDREIDHVCWLDGQVESVVREQVRLLFQRFYFASMEAVEDPDQFLAVKKDVTAKVQGMVTDYGRVCMVSIIRSFGPIRGFDNP